jgi:hypothetical protein
MLGMYSYAHGQVDLFRLPPGYAKGKGKGKGKGPPYGKGVNGIKGSDGKGLLQGPGKGKAMVFAGGKGKAMALMGGKGTPRLGGRGRPAAPAYPDDAKEGGGERLTPRYDPQLVSLYRSQMAPTVHWGEEGPFGRTDGLYVDESHLDWWEIKDDDDEEYQVPSEHL